MLTSETKGGRQALPSGALAFLGEEPQDSSYYGCHARWVWQERGPWLLLPEWEGTPQGSLGLVATSFINILPPSPTPLPGQLLLGLQVLGATSSR